MSSEQPLFRNTPLTTVTRDVWWLWRGFVRFLNLIRDWQPFTVCGIFAFALSLIALKLYAIPENDLVAYIIGGATIFILLIVSVFGLIARLLIGRKLSVELRFDERSALSKREIPAGIILSPISIPPFYSLSIKRSFAQPGPRSPTHLLLGRTGANERRHLIDSVIFPHRAVWQINGVNCTLSDSFGFTSLSWTVANSSSVEVSAPTIPIRPLPIVFGSSRAGDQLSLSRERTGDLFDMKPYDQSDGLSRILWKTYARSGELIVRRPEPAVIPEGEVAIYLVCGRKDDFVAAALQSYLLQLHENQITVLFGTDGLSDTSQSLSDSHSGQHQELSKTVYAPGYITEPEEIQHGINGCVWSSKVGSGLDFQSFVDALAEDNRIVHRVVVFFPDRGDHDWVQRITTIAQKSFLKVTAVLVPENLEQNIQEKKHSNKQLTNKERGQTLPLGPQVTSALLRAGAETLVCERFGS